MTRFSYLLYPMTEVDPYRSLHLTQHANMPGSLTKCTTLDPVLIEILHYFDRGTAATCFLIVLVQRLDLWRVIEGPLLGNGQQVVDSEV